MVSDDRPPEEGEPEFISTDGIPSTTALGEIPLGDATPEGDRASIGPGEFNQEKEDTTARKRIAYWLLGILSVIVAITLAGWVFGKTADEATDVAAKLLAPIVGLIGTVLGFYYANSQNGNGST